MIWTRCWPGCQAGPAKHRIPAVHRGQSVRALDDFDVLAADVCSAVKRRGEQFDDEDQLRSWLDEDGIGYDPQSLAVALRQLEELGRIVRPVQEWSSAPRSPGAYVPPPIYNGP